VDLMSDNLLSFLIAVIPSVITGLITIIGVVISNKTSQAVTDTKIEELTREVREHNNFAKRMPVVEEKIENLTEKVNHFHDI
jgi:endonuclease III